MNHFRDTQALGRELLPLRIAFAAVPFLAGLDKFFGLLADWPAYLSPAVRDLLPIPTAAFFAVVGLIEMTVGVLMLTRFTRVAAYAACTWLLAIAAQLLVAGHVDVAIRDLVMATAAFTLARLCPIPAAALRTVTA